MEKEKEIMATRPAPEEEMVCGLGLGAASPLSAFDACLLARLHKPLTRLCPDDPCSISSARSRAYLHP